MTMKGENKQTLFPSELLPEGPGMRRGLAKSAPLLIFANSKLLHSNVLQLYLSSLSLYIAAAN